MNFMKFKVKDLLTEWGYAFYKVEKVYNDGLQIIFYQNTGQGWIEESRYITSDKLREVKKQELDRLIHESKPPKWVIQKFLDKA